MEEKMGYVRKSDAENLADFLLWIHGKVEAAIQLEENIKGDIDIALDALNRMEEKENE